MQRTGKEQLVDMSHRRGTGADRMAFSGPVGERSGSFSGPVSGPLVNKKGGTKKSARFNIPDSAMKSKEEEDYVEITLDVNDDSVAVHSVKPAGAGGEQNEDPELSLLARNLENKSSFGSLLRSASTRLKKMTSSTRRQPVKIDRSKSAASRALVGLKFISKTDGINGWPAVEKRFDELTTEGSLPRNLFGQCIGMKDSKDFAGELFDALARKRNITSNSVTKDELREFWEQISDPSFDSRLQTFFDMVDKNADGRITETEVRELITLSASANKLSKIQEQADEYAALIMEELDPDNLGYIEVYNLETLLLQGPIETARTSNSKYLSQLLSQNLKTKKETNPIKKWYRSTKYFLQDNWKRVWIVTLWFLICCGLFTEKFIEYKHRAVFKVMGYCVSVAKGGGETLKFNMALILFTVCRNTITWLRNKTKLGVVVPFDDNLNFHKVISVGVIIGVGLHSISHLTCDFPRLLHVSDAGYEPMKPFFGETRPPNFWWFVKGVDGWTGTVMVFLMTIAFTLASPWFRRNKVKLPKPLQRFAGFNAFWYSHHLFIIVYILFIIHGYFLYLTREWYKKDTWMWLAIPILLYFTERVIRVLRSSISPVKILKVAVYPGNVLALHFTKPANFKYKSGQYMFVNCAAVSPFEWHPFSITSSPGEDFLSVHIRTLGDWTRQLKTVFSEVCMPPSAGKSGLLRADFNKGEEGPGPGFPKVLVDGPYGAPAQDYKKYDVVLLVGLGIGATPFISIVKDIINNMREMEESENGMDVETGNNGKNSNSTFRTRKAYFYWVTREQGSFDWFKNVMNEVAETDGKGVIELHNYCTSVYEEGDARSALIAMLQSLNHAKHGVDIVSGTRVKSHFAKPNWRNVYKRIALNHPDQRIGVFYCGAAALTKELRQLALDFSRKTSTKFEFHKENF